jgi:hypothetical protein
MKPGDHPEFFRFPAPEGRSRESTIRLDRDGVFWHDDERVEHAKLAEALQGWVGRHPEDGRYILTNGYDWTYFTVEDAPFQVRAVRHDGGGLRLLLSGGHEVAPLALSVAGDGSLYAEVEVKGQRYEARFSRHAQTQLDPALEDRGGEIGVRVGDLVLVPGPRGGLAFSCAAPWIGAADARRRTPVMPTYLTRNAFLYDRKGPWPQPSPEHPFGEAPAVLHLPDEEQLDWNLHIGLRYTKDLVTHWPVAIAYSIEHRKDPIPDDSAFARLMLDTLYTRFLSKLDPADEALFAAQLAGAGAGVTFWKMDFTAMGLVDPLPELFVSPTITLIRQDGDRSTRRIVAIAVRDLVLEPVNGLSWDLAKAYALQGAAYHVLFVVHPTQHFPMDSVNAITKSAVPMDHLLFKTLFPHTRFSLVLNNAVLEGKSSVVNRHAQFTLYDPLTADADQGLRSLFAAGYVGIKGKESAYPEFDYRTYASRIPDSAYGDYLAAYHAPILQFCTTVAKTILARSPKDEWVKNWSNYIRTWIPSFPKPEELLDADALGAAMATYVWGVTVGHGVDHQSFSADVGIINKFLRLRVPPPTTATTAPFDIDDLYNANDTFRAAMAEKMFFAPTRVTQLVQTEYNFISDDLRAASQDFLANLRAVDGGLARRYMAVEDLPGSIQY